MCLLIQDTIMKYNGAPCIACKCIVKVHNQIKELVEIMTTDKRTYFIGNDNNIGWLKLTKSPDIVVEEIDEKAIQSIVCYVESK